MRAPSTVIVTGRAFCTWMVEGPRASLRRMPAFLLFHAEVVSPELLADHGREGCLVVCRHALVLELPALLELADALLDLSVARTVHATDAGLLARDVEDDDGLASKGVAAVEGGSADHEVARCLLEEGVRQQVLVIRNGLQELARERETMVLLEGDLANVALGEYLWVDFGP